MSVKTDVKLRAAFEGREVKLEALAREVPEAIRRHAPTPVLRPSGSWAKMADAVDQAVREARDAARARSEWAERLRAQQPGKTKGMGY
jgi:hypothetical protein